MNWKEFLEKIADEYGLLGDDREVFYVKFADENDNKNNVQIASILNISTQTLERRLKNIYNKFANKCPKIISEKKGKFEILKAYLKKEYSHQSKTTGEVQRLININWRDLSNPETLPDHLKLKQNVTEQNLELNLYVPLGLMERKEQQRRSLHEDFSINQVYPLPEKEEITRKFEHQEFLDHIGLGTQKPSNNKNIAIIGEPGAGKTTLLDKLAHIIHSENKGLPICISLANLEQNQTIQDYLENKRNRQ